MNTPVIIWWVRRDLRLADNPALAHAVASGHRVIPVFIHDEVIEDLGAAPKWRFGLGIGSFAESLEEVGSRLILRRGRAVDVLKTLVTSADSAVLIINTIAAAGDESPKGRIHIITWGAILTLVIAGLLLAGGLGAINTAMIIGALPFSFVMALMGISLFKALIRDGMREKNGTDTPAE